MIFKHLFIAAFAFVGFIFLAGFSGEALKKESYRWFLPGVAFLVASIFCGLVSIFSVLDAGKILFCG